MSERIERYVLHLSLPADVPARVGPVTVTWPGDPPVEAGVLGAYFVEPAEFMDEQEAALELLPALSGLVEIIDAAGLLNLSNGVQLGPTSWYVKAHDRLECARTVLAKAAPATVPA